MAVTLERERAAWDAGADVVIGVDEVGRGALAGPVTVGAVALRRCDAWPDGLADSKRLTPAARERLMAPLAEFGVARAVGHATPAEIDAYGIVAALRLAATRAVAQIAAGGVAPDAVLLDGKHDWLTPPPDALFATTDPAPPLPDVRIPEVATVVGGDDLCASIAAASVLAKVERDAAMVAAHAEHPEYGWDGNKGYGAEVHLDALRRLGPTDFHRRSWSLPERG